MKTKQQNTAWMHGRARCCIRRNRGVEPRRVEDRVEHAILTATGEPPQVAHTQET